MGTVFGHVAGFRIIEAEYMGDLVTPAPPERITEPGSYRQRKLKRWLRAHPSYYVANGKYLKTASAVICHPEDARKIREMMAAMRSRVNPGA